ncbi:hypothetical protein, partial [Selenomonas bovis]|uniref:hypothetical protein n=1 Tax=Selenomonas bovis TaxID=416586 RepID=UPI001981FE3E
PAGGHEPLQAQLIVRILRKGGSTLVRRSFLLFYQGIKCLSYKKCVMEYIYRYKKCMHDLECHSDAARQSAIHAFLHEGGIFL